MFVSFQSADSLQRYLHLKRGTSQFTINRKTLYIRKYIPEWQMSPFSVRHAAWFPMGVSINVSIDNFWNDKYITMYWFGSRACQATLYLYYIKLLYQHTMEQCSIFNLVKWQSINQFQLGSLQILVKMFFKSFLNL